MKETNAEGARLNASKPLFDPGHANTLTLDTAEMTADEIAECIMQKAEQL